MKAPAKSMSAATRTVQQVTSVLLEPSTAQAEQPHWPDISSGEGFASNDIRWGLACETRFDNDNNEPCCVCSGKSVRRRRTLGVEPVARKSSMMCLFRFGARQQH